MTRKNIPAILCNLFLAGMSFGSWIFMAVLAMKGDTLASNGFESLKYFTVLSNLFNGAVSLCYAIWLVRGSEITTAKKTVKLMATSAVGLTFLTVMVFLGPLYGYGNMFQGSNLWMHLLLPLLSFVTFIFFERGVKVPLKSVMISAIPVLLYEIGYILNMVLHGIGTWPDTNDFYGFMNWGYGVAAVIVVVMLMVTMGIAFLLRLAGGAVEK